VVVVLGTDSELFIDTSDESTSRGLTGGFPPYSALQGLYNRSKMDKVSESPGKTKKLRETE